MDLPQEVLNIKGLIEGLAARPHTLHPEGLEEVGTMLLLQSLDIQSPIASERSSPNSPGLTAKFDYLDKMDRYFTLDPRSIHHHDFNGDAHQGVLAALKVLGRDILPVIDQANAVTEGLKDAEIMTYAETYFATDITEYCLPLHPQLTDSSPLEIETGLWLQRQLLDLTYELSPRFEERFLRWNATCGMGVGLLKAAAGLYWQQNDFGNQKKVAQLLVAISCLHESARGITRSEPQRFRILSPLLREVFEKHNIERTRPITGLEMFVDKDGHLAMPTPDFGGPA